MRGPTNVIFMRGRSLAAVAARVRTVPPRGSAGKLRAGACQEGPKHWDLA